MTDGRLRKNLLAVGRGFISSEARTKPEVSPLLIKGYVGARTVTGRLIM